MDPSEIERTYKTTTADPVSLHLFKHLYLGNPLTGTFANSENPDGQGLHCL